MFNYCINTSADNLYFSRVINLIGSIRKNYDSNIRITVWDLGLTKMQKYILKLIDVNIGMINKNTPHWNQCYSWKLYVYQQSTEDVFFHLDAGNVVLKNLNNIYHEIEEKGMFLIDQGQKVRDIVPIDYIALFNPQAELSDDVFAAGNIGLNKKNPKISKVINEAYCASVDGYCLGYSKSELHRDINGINITRDCNVFRHDQSVINIIMRKHFKTLYLHSHDIYASITKTNKTSVFNSRGYHYGFILNSSSRMISVPLFLYCYFFDIKRRSFRIINLKYKKLSRLVK